MTVLASCHHVLMHALELVLASTQNVSAHHITLVKIAQCSKQMLHPTALRIVQATDDATIPSASATLDGVGTLAQLLTSLAQTSALGPEFVSQMEAANVHQDELDLTALNCHHPLIS